MHTQQIKWAVAHSRPHESIRHCRSALQRSFRLLSEGRSKGKRSWPRGRTAHAAQQRARCRWECGAGREQAGKWVQGRGIGCQAIPAGHSGPGQSQRAPIGGAVSCACTEARARAPGAGSRPSSGRSASTVRLTILRMRGPHRAAAGVTRHQTLSRAARAQAGGAAPTAQGARCRLQAVRTRSTAAPSPTGVLRYSALSIDIDSKPPTCSSGRLANLQIVTLI